MVNDCEFQIHTIQLLIRFNYFDYALPGNFNSFENNFGARGEISSGDGTQIVLILPDSRRFF